jgi:hypothetical protein
MPQARISVTSESEGERDLRAASCPIGNSPKAVPYSSVLAERREIAAKLAAAKAGRSNSKGPKNQHWSSTSNDDTASRGTKSSAGGTSSGKERRLSPRALMRKYRAKVKPRTYLYSVFGLVSTLNRVCSHSEQLSCSLLTALSPQSTSAFTCTTDRALWHCHLRRCSSCRLQSSVRQLRFTLARCYWCSARGEHGRKVAVSSS